MCAKQQRVVADDVLHLSALESGKVCSGCIRFFGDFFPKVVLHNMAFNPSETVKRVVKTYRAEISC